MLAYFFGVSAVDSVKQKLSGKECDKALRVSYHALSLPHRAVGVIVAVPGRTHLLFKLTFSTQFLKVVLQEQQNFLCHVSSVICMNTKKNSDFESDTEMNI